MSGYPEVFLIRLVTALNRHHASAALPGLLAALGPHINDEEHTVHAAPIAVDVVVTVHRLLHRIDTLAALPDVLRAAEPHLRHPDVDPAVDGEARTATGEGLTRREFEVLSGIARGRTNAAISRSLGIAEETVKTHIRAVLDKLGAHDRAQAVARAYQAGYFTPTVAARGTAA